MEAFIDKLNQTVATTRNQIINHPVYDAIDNLAALKVFTEHHVYAVWDFMSLLKSLQNGLTCTSTPWFPKNNGDMRYLINEIVVGEECDLDRHGNRKSHFEMYLDAMRHIGANTATIEQFVSSIQDGTSVLNGLENELIPENSALLVKETFRVIEQEPLYIQAAVFTFGREDLIPDMFLSIVKKLAKTHPDEMADLLYYFERHIEVDGGHHSHLALKMTADLCEGDEQKWEKATQFVHQALIARKKLWDGVLNEINQLEQVTV